MTGFFDLEFSKTGDLINVQFSMLNSQSRDQPGTSFLPWIEN
jgi:hypothetical protein